MEAALAQAAFGAGAEAAVDRQARLPKRGFYDRSLRCRDPHARLVAVVRTVELVDVLPSEPHDVPMTSALSHRARADRCRAGNDGTHLAVLALETVEC